MADGNGLHLLFWFLSGALQGCPASAFLFTVALDPFLYIFEHTLISHSLGILRACADDLGAALRKLAALKKFFPIFALAEAAAGLVLKPSKCIIIPLIPLTPSLPHFNSAPSDFMRIL